MGALIESTLLRVLKNNRLDLAATEFLRWNKATIKGVKTVVSKLTRRRQAESSRDVSNSVGTTLLTVEACEPLHPLVFVSAEQAGSSRSSETTGRQACGAPA